MIFTLVFLMVGVVIVVGILSEQRGRPRRPGRSTGSDSGDSTGVFSPTCQV